MLGVGTQDVAAEQGIGVARDGVATFPGRAIRGLRLGCPSRTEGSEHAFWVVVEQLPGEDSVGWVPPGESAEQREPRYCRNVLTFPVEIACQTEPLSTTSPVWFGLASAEDGALAMWILKPQQQMRAGDEHVTMNDVVAITTSIKRGRQCDLMRPTLPRSQALDASRVEIASEVKRT